MKFNGAFVSYILSVIRNGRLLFITIYFIEVSWSCHCPLQLFRIFGQQVLTLACQHTLNCLMVILFFRCNADLFCKHFNSGWCYSQNGSKETFQSTFRRIWRMAPKVYFAFYVLFILSRITFKFYQPCLHWVTSMRLIYC